MKTENKKKNRGSLFRMLLLHYGVFTLLVVLLAVGILQLSNAAMLEAMKMPQHDYTEKLLRAVETGNYNEIKTAQWIGGDGWFQVLDESGRSVYMSKDGIGRDHYSAEDLSCIPLSGEDNWFAASNELESEDGTALLQYSIYDLSDENWYSQEVVGVLIVEKGKGTIVYSSFDVPEGTELLTEDQQAFLANDFYGCGIQRHHCTLKDGTTGTVLIFQPFFTDNQEKIVNAIDILTIPVFFIFYFVLLTLFGLWLGRRVRKPLNLLSYGMKNLSEGNRGAQLDYHGPKEFEQMCDSFNVLSTRLYETEQSRIQAEAEKQKMLADISHDLKTPISVIQGYARAVSDGIVEPEQQEKYLRTIYQKSVNLNELIDVFHTYSKLEHPDFRLSKSRLDFCEVVRGYLAEKYEEIELAGFELEIQIPEEVVICELDVTQWKRVLDNIFSNALKHNGEGTCLRVTVTPEEDKVQLLIEDNGSGIPEALAEAVFEPFTVGDESRRSGRGSGLGLAISKKIVEAHGGTIELLKAEGEWKTRFSIEILR